MTLRASSTRIRSRVKTTLVAAILGAAALAAIAVVPGPIAARAADGADTIAAHGFSVSERLAAEVDTTGAACGAEVDWWTALLSRFTSAELADTGKRIRTKATLVDAAKYEDGQSIDELVGTARDASEAFLTQLEWKSALYEFGDDAYYAAKLDLPHEAGVCGRAADWAFARDTYDGQLVEGAIYDAASGVAYVPKAAVDAYVPADASHEQGCAMQAQLLFSVDAGKVGDMVEGTAEVVDADTGAAFTAAMAGSLSGNAVYVQLADVQDAAQIDPQGISVTINDGAAAVVGTASGAADDATTSGGGDVAAGEDDAAAAGGVDTVQGAGDAAVAGYDASTGVLGIAVPAAAAAKVEVSYKGAGAAAPALASARAQLMSTVSEMECVPGVEFAGLDLDALQEGWTFGSAVYVDASGADEFAGRDVDHVYYPDPLSEDGYVDQGTWDGMGSGTNFERIGDRYPAGSVAGQRIAYNMSFLIAQSDDGGPLASSDEMRTAIANGWAAKGLWTSAEDEGNPAVQLNWGFSATAADGQAPTVRMFSALCTHAANPFSYEADGGMCTAYTKVVAVDREASTITLAFMANLGGDNGGQTCSQVAKFRVKKEETPPEPEKGWIEVCKTSAEPGVTNGNARYSLEGAVYGIYSDEACTAQVAELVTDAKGYAKSGELDPRTYWVKEKSASKGYRLDAKKHEALVKNKETARVDSEELLEKGWIELEKKSGNEEITKGNACYKLASAVYGIYADKACTRLVAKLTTDEKGYAKSGELDIGVYWVKETAASTGYALDLEVREAEVKGAEVVRVTSTETAQNASIDLLLQKTDRETGKVVPQGSASLAGAEFTVRYYDDHYDSADALPASAERSWVLKTDEQGKVALDDAHKVSGDAFYLNLAGKPCIPIGTVSIQETKAPDGYVLEESEPEIRRIEGGGAKATVETVEAFNTLSVSNQVVRGGVEVLKKDRELDGSEALGGHEHDGSDKEHSSLAGIVFTITNKSAQAVRVDGVDYEPGQVVKSIETAWDEASQSYRAATSLDCLPCGDYEIAETATNRSYLLSDGAPRSFQIRAQGEFAGFENSFANQAVRNDLRLQKKAEGSSEALAKVAFALVNEATGETHVIVTDENGMLDTAGGLASHSMETNAFDALLGADGGGPTLDAVKERIAAGTPIATADIEALGEPGRVGTWFGRGEAGGQAQPDDALAALPYGSYLLYELPCEANEGFLLFSTQLRIYADVSVFARGYDLGTVTDYRSPQPPSLHTTAVDADDEDKYLAATAQARIMDTVSYSNLEPGASYTVSGTLVDKETGEAVVDADGQVVAASMDFEAPVTDGHVELVFTLDAGELGGHDLVVFEKLLREGEELAAHEDLEDAGQTVRVVEIGTTARDGEDGDKYVSGEEAQIVDSVSYNGLEPGSSYTARGTLMDKESGKALRSKEGGELVSSVEFTPEQRSGSVEVPFALDAGELGGCELVVFERVLDKDGKTVAVHEDLGDEAQTVRVPALATTLVEAESGGEGKLVRATKKVALVDSIAYEGFAPGQEYTISGVLMDKETGEALEDDAGDPVAGSTSFTAQESSGTAEVAFELDSSELAGKQLVAFETASDEKGETIVEHADLESASQTVEVEESPDAPAPPAEEPAVPEEPADDPAPVVEETPAAEAPVSVNTGYAAADEPVVVQTDVASTGDAARRTVLFALAAAAAAGIVFAKAAHRRARLRKAGEEQS